MYFYAAVWKIDGVTGYAKALSFSPRTVTKPHALHTAVNRELSSQSFDISLAFKASSAFALACLASYRASEYSWSLSAFSALSR